MRNFVKDMLFDRSTGVSDIDRVACLMLCMRLRFFREFCFVLLTNFVTHKHRKQNSFFFSVKKMKKNWKQKRRQWL